MKPKYQVDRWYLYKNGDYKEIFKCIEIDGEYLYYTPFPYCRGYSSLLCRPVSKAYRILHSNLIRCIP